jgi:hypothetical protein
MLLISASLAALASSGVVDEKSAHRLGGNGQEVNPVLELGVLLSDQTDARFIDQRRRLQSVIRSLSRQEVLCNAVKLVIDKRDQLGLSIGVPFSPLTEKVGHVRC